MLLVGLWLNGLFELCCCAVVLEGRLYTPQLPFAAVYVVVNGSSLQLRGPRPDANGSPASHPKNASPTLEPFVRAI
ncbi:hypothetical protein HYDPIDRAFT_108671 [Hydnomerulius pinastri MD-312]|nr:hypothetical protein HYDPIDRAFT_108671 [Hydnomerulius pinastri MD-312]